VEIPDEVARRMAAAVADQGVAPEILAGQVLTESLPPRRSLGFVALGSSMGGGRLTART
jgi:hypothetical protein